MQMEVGREVSASNTFKDQSSACLFGVTWTAMPLLQDFRQQFAEALIKSSCSSLKGCMKNSNRGKINCLFLIRNSG